MIIGRLEEIFITETHGSDLSKLLNAELIEGCGIVGDRYFCKEKPKQSDYISDEEVTFIAIEDLIDVKNEHNINLLSGQHRRNLVTRGIKLISLIGCYIKIGSARIFICGNCDPCDYLEELTESGIKSVLFGRGGLRGRIVQGGVIRVGDQIILDDSVV